ncbi:phage tail assembly chaperone [Pseudomonas asplenii]|uniref:phage tail assembly chaperone n=1 Tax=Pseudomonas asplenii TaxID=53407 RepID=UPI0006B66ACA|nr:phage tail assembly chaperone [Pseudomonas fuscovaginae]
MKRLYSQSTQTTYIEGLHGQIPGDAVEMADELFFEVIVNPVPGKIRAHGQDGLPYLVDEPPPPEPDVSVIERAWRDTELSKVTWLRDRHRDELEIGSTATFTDEQYKELLLYMQALRDWPQSGDFPDPAHRPAAPLWIADQTE